MPRQRRERGEGTIFYDSARDRWVGQLDLGTDQTGRRVRPKVFGRTRAAVRTRLEELKAAHKAGQEVDQRTVTFADLADEWLAVGLPPGTSVNTIDNYSTILDRHLKPALGRRKAVDLRPRDFESVLAEMAEREYSARTMRLTLNLARRVLAFAERRGVLVRNVAAVVEHRRGPATQRRGLTSEEARALLAAACGHRLEGLITLSLLLGLRPGEAAGLTWGSVNLDADPPTLRVAASLQRNGSALAMGPVKTASSRRTLALPSACVDALEQQIERQARDRRAAGQRWVNDHDLVFTTEHGGPLDPSNVRRDLQAVATKAGLGHIHPHLLRHAAASLLSEAGVRIEDIADTLGHRSITVTAEVYRHRLAPVRTGHVGAMEALRPAHAEGIKTGATAHTHREPAG